MGQQTEDLTLNTPDTATMNNQYNQRPGYPYNAPYNYNAPPPYSGIAPYPTNNAYGMPTPMGSPMSNYSYYPPIPTQQDQIPRAVVVTNPPMYPPPYTQTRMANPAPYPIHNPIQNPSQPPPYNYNTTNLISRPPRPVSLYPQINQMPQYPPYSAQIKNVNNNNSVQSVVKNEPPSVDDNSRKLSELSIGVRISLFKKIFLEYTVITSLNNFMDICTY